MLASVSTPSNTLTMEPKAFVWLLRLSTGPVVSQYGLMGIARVLSSDLRSAARWSYLGLAPDFMYIAFSLS
jgi:hypothetical protein